MGNEPDGIQWAVYRSDDAGTTFQKIATIYPRDVQPESNYATNPGIVKENTTPSNYTDPTGTAASIYEVAPVINGVEGDREGMAVPMLASVGSSAQAGRAAATYIPLKAAPATVPLAQFTYRNLRFGPGASGPGVLSASNSIIPGTSNNWYTVDMDLLKEFRIDYQEQNVVTQVRLQSWVDKLNEYNTTPNALGVATYTSPRLLVNSLVSGKITEALYNELEGEFIKYVKNLDCGESLTYALNDDGSVRTGTSANYATQDMTVGDFDGDGEYEIVVKWRGTQVDPMYSEPIYSGGSATTGAPEYIDVYKLDGSLLFRIDMGYNVRAANDHETTMFAQDYDGDGKAELMLKTALGTRIGNWDEATQAVVYPDTLTTVVGGQDGLASTTEKFKEYFTTGNTQALDTYWSMLNSFTISYRSPTSGGGNDGPNDPAVKRWIKTYHVGPIGPAKDGQEFFSAFEWDPDAGKGILVDSAQYPFTYAGSVDGDNWAVNPTSQRGNFEYLAYPGPGAGSSSADYKARIIQEKDAYWLTHPWKAAVWGDAQGNRANRYLGVTAALDGVNQYAVSQRGYYQRTTFAAYRIEDGKVVLKAAFDSADPQYWTFGGSAYDYQNRGNHNTDAGDLDGDGRDEIVMSAMVLQLTEDGKKIMPEVINGDIMPTIVGQTTDGVTDVPVPGVFDFVTDAVRNNPANVWAPLRHGDRGAVLPVDKDNNIRMMSGSEEHLLDDQRTGYHLGWIPGPEAHDPLKGKRLDESGQVVYESSLIYGLYQASDDEGSVAGNFSNRWPGAQGGTEATQPGEVRSMITGEVLYSGNTARGIAQGQYAIWFGGGLTAMAVAGATINSVNDATFATTAYVGTGGTSTGNKGTATLKADLLGDWREEVILRGPTGNSGACNVNTGTQSCIGIFTSLAPTQYGIRTLMHDGMYRNGVANKNTGYDQFGFASFYLGDEAELPAKPAIEVVDAGVIQEAPTYERAVTYGTSVADLALPETLDVTVDTGVTRTVPVIWDTSTYDSNATGTQTISGTLGTTDRITNPYGVVAGVNVMVSAADTRVLTAVIGVAKSLDGDLDGFTDASVAALQAELATAEAALANAANLTQAEVDQAAAALQEALDNLATKPAVVDAAVLDHLVDGAKGLSNEDGVYSDDSWAALQAAIAEAEAVLAGSAAQAEIDQAVRDLNAALLALEPAAPERPSAVVDKAVLNHAIDGAKALSNDGGTYTANSWAALQAALVQAQGVSANAGATQEEVNQAAQGLNSALLGLVLAGATPSTPAPSPSASPSAPGQLPVTGAEFGPVVGWAIALLLVGAGLLAVRRRVRATSGE
ncbi:MAG: FIVAR domain-containing protein [Bifidobacteriaceae bacterium]|nr:FIVAR domain-containing protein [Bifidobacteriaceae bacterium]